MALFSYEDADKYGSQSSGGSYFKLEDDGDTARVRLLGKDINDFPGYACHEIKVWGNDNKEHRKLVNCLREYNESVDVCPFCKARMKVIAKVFVPMYNIDDDEIQVWERGKKFYPVLAGYAKRHKNLYQWVTEIVRSGKAKSTDTTYQLYADDEEGRNEDISLDEYEIPEILGRYILDKSAEDMEYFLDNEEFPGDDEEDEKPTRRRERREDDSQRRSRRGGRKREDDEEF